VSLLIEEEEKHGTVRNAVSPGASVSISRPSGIMQSKSQAHTDASLQDTSAGPAPQFLSNIKSKQINPDHTW
jgi:hypothetical protein